MDFFIENGIKKEDIEKVYKTYSEDDIFLFEHNSEDVMNIYNYFKEIGIEENNIIKLLIIEKDIFLMNLDTIKERFNKFDITSLVKVLNNNIELIVNYI